MGRRYLLVQSDELLDACAVQTQLLHNRREIILEEQHPRFGVIEDVDQLGRSESHI